MSAHRPHRTVGAIVLALLAPLVVLALPSPASAVHVTVPVTVDDSTTQLGRMFRDAVPSTCGTAKPYPGGFSEATTFNAGTTTFVAPTSGCLTITRSNVTCLSDTNLHLSVYLATYHRREQDAHYLGDQGSSDDSQVIGIDVEKGKEYVVVATNTATQEACGADVTFDLADDTTPPDTVFLRTPPAKVRTSSAVLTFSGQPAADTAGLQCQVDGAAFAACTSPLELEGLAVGTHTVSVRAVDDFGNIDPTPATATFLSCDLATAARDLDAATTALDRAAKAVTKAKKAVTKASTPKAKAKAKKKLAKATKKAKAAKKQVAVLRTGIRSCAQ